MKFTRYVMTENSPTSIDPLGFLRPAARLADTLFPQFTVLSNHPAYHGFLAFGYGFLAENRIYPGQREFPRAFRDLEVLWGILNVRANKSVLNVTKYQPLVGEDGLTLSSARSKRWLRSRLNYGALGHYSNPSINWRILNERGTGLLPLGHSLAGAWGLRDGARFQDVATEWWADHPVFVGGASLPYERNFNIAATPASEERKVWQRLIEGACARDPATAPMWENPIPDETLALKDDERAQQGFFPAVLDRYRNFPELCRRLRLCESFERLAALIQFVFEWEYVSRLESVRVVGLVPGVLSEVVARLIHGHAKAFIESQGESENWTLPFALSRAPNHESMVETILAHHADHQKSKSQAPYIAGKEVAVRDRVDDVEFRRFFENVARNPDSLDSASLWRYRRDWHFNRADLWCRYAGIK